MLARMRIAAMIYEGMLSSLYRSLVPMQALAHRGHSVHVEERMMPSDPNILLDFDVVHFCRSCHRPMQQLARGLRRAGVGVVWDNDDDIRTIPAGHPMGEGLQGYSGQHITADMAAMMKLADVVTTPTEVLAERYREMSGADVRVLENFLPPTFERPERVMPHGSAVRIGWLATAEHVGDRDQLRIRETLEQLLQRHAHLEIVSIGMELGVRSRRYEAVPFSVYAQLPTILSHLDIGIAPLADIDFNRVRSNVKLKEYAAVGLPWLASPIGPYAGMGEDQGGRLVPDDRWHAELDALITDADERRRLGFRGRRWAEQETIEHHVERWEQVLQEAAERAAAPRAVR
jgi:glycosyltransferase involved in cell wall biosynthesis